MKPWAVKRDRICYGTTKRAAFACVYGDGSQSFIFVYRIDDRQHFIRIGKTPIWSLEAARDRAKKLRSILNEGDDPACYHKLNNVAPVENVIRYIAEHLQTKP